MKFDFFFRRVQLILQDLIAGKEDSQIRDSNGFYNCRSCTTVHHSQEEYRHHCQAAKHMETVQMMAHSIELPDLSAGWETMGISGIWQSKGNSEEYKKELEKVKEELAEEKKQKTELAKEISDLKESLKVEKAAKEELADSIETLKKESVASALKERTSWEKQIKVSKQIFSSLTLTVPGQDSQTEVRELSTIMNLLNKELKDLREEQKRVRAEAVRETEAKNRKIIKELEDKLEAALVVESQKREAAEDSLATEVEKREAVETEVASEVEDLKNKNRDLEDKLNMSTER